MNTVELIRNGQVFINKLTGLEDNKISEYKIITDERTFTMSREQVELLYRNYVRDGYDLSIKDLSTYFSLFSSSDLVKIRIAFSNTFGLRKEDTIITPHEIEEHSLEELKSIVADFIRHKKVLGFKNDLPDILMKIIDEQKEEIAKLQDYKLIIEEKFKDIPFTTPIINCIPSSKSLAIWISDMHIGCQVTPSLAPMNVNIGWNNQMVIDRLNKLLLAIKQQGHFDDIWVFNLGDAIDGMDHTTSRREKDLPQNMNNMEMARYYLQDINYLFDTMIVNNMANAYHFRTVSQSNHGGDFEALTNEFLIEQLKHKGIDSAMPETAFGVTQIQEIPIVFGHGKDSLHQIRPLGVQLDNRTKAYIDSLLRAKGLASYFGNILVVKGDSHQYHLSGCADYMYMSVGSLFGSSEWAQSNFPHRGWEINYSIFENGNVMHGSVKDNKPYNIDVQFN